MTAFQKLMRTRAMQSLRPTLAPCVECYLCGRVETEENAHWIARGVFYCDHCAKAEGETV